MMDEYTVYAKIDSEKRIIDVNSSDFVSAGWGIMIDCGCGDKYHHAQGNYFEGGLFTDDGICRWKYSLETGTAVARTQEEIDYDRSQIPDIPSQREIDRADIDFCLMMLEG